MPAVISGAGRVYVCDAGTMYVASENPAVHTDTTDPSTMKTTTDGPPANGDTVVAITTQIGELSAPAAFTGPVYHTGDTNPYLGVPADTATALYIPGNIRSNMTTLYEKTIYFVCRPERESGINSLFGRVQSVPGARVVIGVGTSLRVLYGAVANPLVHSVGLTLGVDAVVAVQISQQRGIVALVNGTPQTLLGNLGGAYDVAAHLQLDLAMFQYGDSSGHMQNTTQGFVGRFYAMEVYDSVHDTLQMQRNSDVLRERWGLPGIIVPAPPPVLLPPPCVGLHVSAVNGSALYNDVSSAVAGGVVTRWRDTENAQYLAVSGGTYSEAGGGHSRNVTLVSTGGIYLGSLELSVSTSYTVCYAMKMTSVTAGQPLLAYVGHLGLAYNPPDMKLGINSWNGGFYGAVIPGGLYNKWVVIFAVLTSTSVGALELAVWDSTGLLYNCPTQTSFGGSTPGISALTNVFTFSHPAAQKPIGAFGELFVYPGIVGGSDRTNLIDVMRSQWL